MHRFSSCWVTALLLVCFASYLTGSLAPPEFAEAPATANGRLRASANPGSHLGVPSGSDAEQFIRGADRRPMPLRRAHRIPGRRAHVVAEAVTRRPDRDPQRSTYPPRRVVRVTGDCSGDDAPA